jgi:L-glutamine-phosphate cytidylyltransferase
MQLIILAAGQGTRLRPLTENCPKCLVEIKGKSILQWQIETAVECGIDLKDITVIGGYQAAQLYEFGINVVENTAFNNTNMVYTLFCAKKYFSNDMIVSYGDIIYEKKVLEKLLASSRDISIVIDKNWKGYWQERFDNPLEDAETLKLNKDSTIYEIGKKTESFQNIEGQYIGLIRFKNDGVKELLNIYLDVNEMADKHTANNIYMTDLLMNMINNKHKLYAIEINRGWFEIDNLKDYELAQICWDK